MKSGQALMRKTRRSLFQKRLHGFLGIPSRECNAEGIDAVFNRGVQVGRHPAIDQVLLESDSGRAMLVDLVADRLRTCAQFSRWHYMIDEPIALSSNRIPALSSKEQLLGAQGSEQVHQQSCFDDRGYTYLNLRHPEGRCIGSDHDIASYHQFQPGS